MGLIESIFNRLGFVKKQSNTSYIDFLDGNGAFYNLFGEDIYASDVVQQAITTIIKEMKKLEPVHVIRKYGRDPRIVDDQIQKVLEKPNDLMTTSYYIEKMMWNYFLNYNAFAYPLWEGNKLISITPLQPTNVEFYMTPSKKMWVTMKFKNGYVGNVPYENLIHLRRNYSLSDVMGGNEKGQPDNKATLEILKLNDKLLKGLAKQMDMQMSVQGWFKQKTVVGKEPNFEYVKDFENKIKQYGTAFIPVDNGSEVGVFNKNIQFLSKEVLDFLDSKILRQFGVSIAMITGDFSVEQYNAFHQKEIEPLIVDWNQVHTAAIFTGKESFGYGHKIEWMSGALSHMSNSQKLEYYKMIIDIGAGYKNEVRMAFGDRPLKELEGQLAISSNQQNALNNKTDDTKKPGVDEPEEDEVIEDEVIDEGGNVDD